MIRFGIALLVAGGIMTFFGVREWRMKSASSDQPEEVALRDLVARSGAGNPNIVLKDFVFCDNFVYSYEGSKDRWQKVYIPVVDANVVAQAPGPLAHFGAIHVDPGAQQKIAAIVMSNKIHGQTELERFCNQTKVQGLVVNSMMSLEGQEQKLLREKYPTTDFSKCIIIQAGREPASPVLLAVLLGGGIIALVGGVLLMLFPLIQKLTTGPVRRDEVLPADEEER